MNQTPPKRLLQDPSVSPRMRQDMLDFQAHAQSLPFDTSAQLARFEATLAGSAAGAAAGSGSASGVGAGTSSASGVAGSASAIGAGTSTAAGVAGSAKGLFGLSTGVWATAATLVLGGAGLIWMSRDANPPAPAPPSAAASPLDAAPSSGKALTPAPKPVTPSLEDTPSLGADLAPVKGGQADLLQAELAAIAQAKQKLRAKDPKSALEVLARFKARGHKGSLAPERQALEIIAMANAGQRQKARRAARRFLAAHPESPMASRIRRVLK